MSQINVDNIKNRLGSGAPSFPNGIDVSSGVTTFTNGLNVGTGASVFSPGTNVLALGTNSAERVRINSSGNVGIGTDNPDEKFEVYGGKIKVDGGGNRWITIDPGSSTTYEPRIEGSHELVFRSYVASGSGVKTCTFTSNGDLDLTQGRNLKFASGNGIDFSATDNGSGTTTSELLDDYEEGTWTPTVIGSSTAGTVTYGVQRGKYTKIGDLVHVELYVNYTNGTGTGELRISGLPFTVSSSSSTYPGLSIGYLDNVTLSANHTPIFLFSAGNTYIYNYQIPSGGGTNITIPYDSNATIIVSGAYKI